MRKKLLLLFTTSVLTVGIASAGFVPMVNGEVVEWGTTVQSDSLITFYSDNQAEYYVGVYVGNAEEFQAYFGTDYQNYYCNPVPGGILLYQGYGPTYIWGEQGIDINFGSGVYGQHNLCAVYNNGEFVGELFEVPEPTSISILTIGGLTILRKRKT